MFDDNVRVGKCEWVWASGGGYEGVCVSGGLVGVARRRVGGVGEYDGTFRDGVFHGAGVMVYEDGGIFDGEWCHGRRSKGKYSCVFPLAECRRFPLVGSRFSLSLSLPLSWCLFLPLRVSPVRAERTSVGRRARVPLAIFVFVTFLPSNS